MFKAAVYVGSICLFSHSITSTKLDIIINQTFYSRIPQKNTFKNYICITQSKKLCLQFNSGLFQTAVRKRLKNGKHCFEYKIQECNSILSEYYYKATVTHEKEYIQNVFLFENHNCI